MFAGSLARIRFVSNSDFVSIGDFNVCAARVKFVADGVDCKLFLGFKIAADRVCRVVLMATVLVVSVVIVSVLAKL